MTLNREARWTHEGVLSGTQDRRDSPHCQAGRSIERGSEANITAIRCDIDATRRGSVHLPKLYSLDCREDKFSEAPRKEKPLVHNQATSRSMDRCSLCGQPKTRLEFSWTLL